MKSYETILWEMIKVQQNMDKISIKENMYLSYRIKKMELSDWIETKAWYLAEWIRRV
jgi:hypothetical protein